MKKRKQKQKGRKKKIVLGVTGAYGSGKSSIARMFSASDAEVIDADRIAHTVIRKKEKAYKRLIRAFGKEILGPDKSINRKRLAKLVFANKDLLRRLNKITHPQIISIIKKKVKSSSKKIIILDAPLLIEAGLRGLADKLVVVKIARKEQFRRLLRKTKLKKEAILKRIKSQMPQKVKVRIADFLIDNSGSRESTKEQVEAIRRSLWRS